MPGINKDVLVGGFIFYFFLFPILIGSSFLTGGGTQPTGQPSVFFSQVLFEHSHTHFVYVLSVVAFAMQS